MDPRARRSEGESQAPPLCRTVGVSRGAEHVGAIRGNGVAGTEWRFRVQPPGERHRPLVPDVAFLSYDRLPYEAINATEEPLVAPDAVVEVLSPTDDARHVAEKIRVYLAAGTTVVFVVDPQTRSVRVIDSDGERHLGESDIIECSALPEFALRARELFDLPPARGQTFRTSS